MKILITGSNGLLGQKLIAQLKKSNIEFLATSQGENRNPDCPAVNYESLDITNKLQVQEVVNNFLPNVIIHTAAMTNVDACEKDPENCKKINVDGTKHLFEAAVELNAQFISLSTDFVFDGENGPYKEDDKRNPLSVYAQSKVDAEDLLLKSEYKNWNIVRTIIVFGKGHNLSRSNIVLWAYDALKKGDPLNIVDDQYRAPTWADDLAWACIKMATSKKTGIFHICGPKTYSIYELVLAIGAHYKLPTNQINRTSSNSLNQAAKRPPKTGFILDKAREELGYNPLKLEQSLDALNLD